MSTWRVRNEGSPQSVEVSSAQKVLDGVRDGDWELSAEVRGPNDTKWIGIADHPQFAEVLSELDEVPFQPEEEANLDMNPLIDVSLVLLIFFMLTTTYSSLRRAIELPPEPPEKEGKSVVVKASDLKDRAFKVVIRMDEGKVVVKIEDKQVNEKELEKEIIEFVKATGRKEMFVDVTQNVPWGIEAALYDAAKGADIHQIYWPKGR